MYAGGFPSKDGNCNCFEKISVKTPAAMELHGVLVEKSEPTAQAVTKPKESDWDE